MTVLTFHTFMRKSEFMGKSGFSNLGKVKKHFENNWGWFVNDRFV